LRKLLVTAGIVAHFLKVTSNVTKNNRERQAEFKRRMRDAGKKQITVWVTPAQEETIRTLLNQEEAGMKAPAATQNPPVMATSKSPSS
jgi:hypothetical protein